MQLKTRGFALLELLVVVVIMSMVMAISMPAIKGLAGAGRLTGAGSLMENLFTVARQTSISKNTYTAVIVLTDTTQKESAYRAFAILELDRADDGSAATSANWKQTCPWQILPQGIIVDNNVNATTFFSALPTNFSTITPTLIFQGKTYAPDSGYAYQIFLPSGRLSAAPSPCSISLTQGFYNAASPTYTTGSNTNYFNLTFNDATGQTKISRP